MNRLTRIFKTHRFCPSGKFIGDEFVQFGVGERQEINNLIYSPKKLISSKMRL